MKSLVGGIVGIGLIALCTMIGTAAKANQIGLGINWKSGIFVQEYWTEGVNGKPRYLIANTTAHAVTVAANDPRLAAIASPGKSPINVAVNANTVADVPASDFLNRDLVAFKLADGSDLGLLTAPNLGGYKLPADVPVQTFYGLNGSGGSSTDICVEQQQAAYYGGDTFTLRLRMHSLSGTITTRAPTAGYAIPGATLVSVESATMVVVKKADGQYTVTAPASRDSVPYYDYATLTYHAPSVQNPTLALVDMYYDMGQAGGRGITRGVLVRPAKSKMN